MLRSPSVIAKECGHPHPPAGSKNAWTESADS
jgi:hypothetical protein